MKIDLTKLFRIGCISKNYGKILCDSCMYKPNNSLAKYWAINNRTPRYVIPWCGNQQCGEVGENNRWVKIADIDIDV